MTTDTSNHLDSIHEQNPGLVIKINESGKIIYANKSSQELLDLWNLEINDLLANEILEQLKENIHQKNQKKIEISHQDKFFLLSTSTDPESKITHIYGLDISEFKITQSHLEQANAQLEEEKSITEMFNQEVEVMRQQVEKSAEEVAKSSKYKSEFLANMSHELRSPLNSLLILAKLLKENSEGNLTEQQIEYSRIIYNSGKDLLSLINDILDLSKVESGKLNIEITEISFDSLINSLHYQFIHLAKEKNIDYNIELAANIPSTIQSDELRLQQILKNFLSNAFKFTSKGSVSLKIAYSDSSSLSKASGTQILSFSVIDTGIGIPEDKQDSIFQAFQQADGSTTRKYGGTGLGLSISRELSKLLGGDIQVHSQSGKGSTFSLYLPVKTEKNSSESNTSTDLAPTPKIDLKPIKQISVQNSTQNSVSPMKNTKIMQGKKVLLVDDDMRNIFSLSACLKSFGFEIIVAENGQIALDKLECNDNGDSSEDSSIDIVLMDIMMPIMDGYEAMQKIRSVEKWKALPIIALTANAMPEDRKKCIQAGANHYLSKPVDINELILEMNKLLKNII